MKFLRLSLVACAVLLAGSAFAQDNSANALNASTYNETRISALEEQMRVLNGRIEQVEFAVRRLDQTVQRMQSDNDARLTKLENAQAAAAAAPPPPQPVTVVPPPQQQPAPTPVVPDGTLGALKVQIGKVTGGVKIPGVV